MNINQAVFMDDHDGLTIERERRKNEETFLSLPERPVENSEAGLLAWAFAYSPRLPVPISRTVALTCGLRRPYSGGHRPRSCPALLRACTANSNIQRSCTC